METKIQKWGNSLAVRIPKPFASEVGLRADTEVQLSVDDGRLIIIPLDTPSFSLEALLAEVNESNLHSEVDAGVPQGVEFW